MNFDQIVKHRRSARSFDSKPVQGKDLIAIIEKILFSEKWAHPIVPETQGAQFCF